MNLSERKYDWRDSITIPFTCAPLWMTIRTGLTVLERVIPTLQILAMASLLNAAVKVLSDGAAARSVILPIIIIGGLITLDRLSSAMEGIADQQIRTALSLNFRSAVTQKRASLQYAYVEDSETSDLISRISSKPEDAVYHGFQSLLGLSGIAIQVIGLMAVVWNVAWWAVLFLLTVTAVIAVIGLKGGQADYRASSEVSKIRRRYEYLGEVLLSRESADERSLFCFSQWLNTQWLRFFDEYRLNVLRANRIWFIRSKTGNILAILVFVLVAGMLLPAVHSGTMSLGLFIAVVQSMSSFVYSINWEVSRNLEAFAKQNEYYKELTSFAGLPNEPGVLDPPRPPVEPFRSLEFRNVSFRYPGTQIYVLKNISFTIQAGHHYSLVGINGAGKTTIIKLITGLYREFDGEILLNGKSIRDLSLSELKATTAVHFQDFARYQTTISDFIALGNVASIDQPPMEQRILSAAREMGLDELLANLPQGIHTPIGQLSGRGNDLSGGEWQRAALARIILSPAPLKILDEPTAALDPIAESNLYSKFQEICQGWTTLLISHRLGSTKLADEIWILSDGTIAERGTHQELMHRNGIYRQMYDQQRAWYQ